MSYDCIFGNRASCDNKDKKMLLDLIKEILDQSKLARSAGFIVLGQNAETISRPFLRESVRLLGKGWDPDSVERILDIRISVSRAEGADLLEMAMVKEGVLSILRGDPVGLTEELLFSFLGPAAIENFRKGQIDDHRRYLQQLSKAEARAKTESGKWLIEAEDNEISFLLKAFDWESLTTILKEESDGVKYRIYTNLSSDAGKQLRERLQTSRLPDKARLQHAEQLFAKLREKIDSGEAVHP